MNKREFGKLYQKNFEGRISVNEAIEEVDFLLELITDTIIKEEKIKFVNRGTFEIIEKKPRRIADPVTKEPKIIYPKKDIKFKVSENAKKEI